MRKTIYFFTISILITLSSCSNGDWEFPDYEFNAVYFPYQFPVRTVTLGEDIFDTSLDNQGKVNIMATLAGVYENSENVTVDVQVDNSLTDNLQFSETGNPVLPLPDSYYNLASNQIVIKPGSLTGGVEVQLTDAFFADPKSLENNYVIPVLLKNLKNADSLLSGEALVANPRRPVSSDWSVQPKDYILYAVKYINQYEGNYLRRGQDIFEGKNGRDSLSGTVTRREQYVEDDQVVFLDSKSLDQVSLNLVFQNAEGYNFNVVLLINIQEDGSATVTSANPEEYEVSGTGEFLKDGEKNSWGGKDHDALYLSYNIDLDEVKVTTKDTLVLRDRGVAMETFSPVVAPSESE